jgi:iron-sulfur cluster insertion protein
MNTSEIASSLTLTETALKRVAHLKQEHGHPDTALRIYIIGGGCSGFQYGFKLDDSQPSDDIIISSNIDNQTITVVIDPLSFQYLQNATVDYRISLQGSSFVVTNPNAETTCGCGSSFSLKE